MRSLSVLHVCNNYFGTKVYPELIEGLLEHGVDSYILVVLPNKENYLKIINSIGVRENVKLVIIPNIVNNISKIFPKLRVLFLLKLISEFKSRNIDVIHSHTVHSNGAIGSWLSNKLKIPHILSVRNVDINTVYNKSPFHRKIILNRISTSKTIFINRIFFDFIKKEIKDKNINNLKFDAEVIPNSINDYWIKNKYQQKKINKSIVNIIFIGEYTSNKNIDFLLDVFETQWLKNIYFNVQIIGYLDSALKNNRQYYAHIKSRVEKNNHIKMLDKIDDKEVLRDHYRNSDIFFMTSFYETFGLVYAEAMSQGVPIIYTKGQGIDGFYEDGVIGFPVDPANIEQARFCVESILDNYQTMSENCISLVDDFSKKENINKIIEVYKNARENRV